jgi:hypothetical protein
MTATQGWALIGMFLVWNALLWCAACVFLASYGGWRALAKRYPHHTHAGADRRAGGMLMIGDRWNGAIRVHIDPGGIALGPAPLMNVAHPKMLLPWPEITPLIAGESPVIESTHIHVGGQCIAFFGKAADLVDEGLARYRPGIAAVPAPAAT